MMWRSGWLHDVSVTLKFTSFVEASRQQKDNDEANRRQWLKNPC